MNGSDLNKVKQNIIEKFKGIIKDNLLAVVLTGSASQDAYKTGWNVALKRISIEKDVL